MVFTDFFTHIRLMIWMMPPPLSFFFFFFFSSLSDCYCTEFFLDLRDDWTSGLLFFYCTEIFLDLREDNFCSLFSSALTFLRTFHWIFREERLAWKDSRKIEIGSCEIRILNPHHFLPLEKFLPVLGIEPGSALPIMSLMHLLQRALMQTWKLDNSSSWWGV